MIIAGTGHRPGKIYGYNNEDYLKLIGICSNYLREYPDIDEVISGMAQGFDQALAQAALNIGISVRAAVPCRGQEKKWTAKAQRYYQKLLSQCHKVVYISETYTKHCMQDRNIYMVDECDKIFAMWDGSSGGTKNCVDYADSKKKEIINLYDTWETGFLLCH